MNFLKSLKIVVFLIFIVFYSCTQNKKNEQVNNNKITKPDTLQLEVTEPPKPSNPIVKKATIPEDEKEIRAYIKNVNQSWEKLFVTKDKNEIMQYFAPAFIANEVSIYSDNSGNIKDYTNEDFPKFIKSITKRKGYKYEFANVRFLDIEIKNDIYFNVVYKSKLVETTNENKTNTSSVIINVTCKKINAKWKIGYFSWVEFENN